VASTCNFLFDHAFVCKDNSKDNSLQMACIRGLIDNFVKTYVYPVLLFLCPLVVSSQEPERPVSRIYFPYDKPRDITTTYPLYGSSPLSAKSLVLEDPSIMHADCGRYLVRYGVHGVVTAERTSTIYLKSSLPVAFLAASNCLLRS
jgi:hypothetical protein